MIVCVRYVDTGSRDPQHALGTWLGEVLVGVQPVTSIRVQTGFFGSGALGYFEGALRDLRASNGHTRFLIGSNEGETLRGAVQDLLTIAGPPRSGLKLGVVSFRAGFFHPKVFHVVRADGSAAAYIGSANLTPSGTTSQHVEAGIILDTKARDPQEPLDIIAAAIDGWFIERRGGFYPVESAADLDPLVEVGILGMRPSARPIRTGFARLRRKQLPGHVLNPLVAIPPIQTALSFNASTSEPEFAADPSPDLFWPSPGVSVEVHWSKTLSASDAQRKKTGNQSGAVALTQGDYARKIDQTTFFRRELFGGEVWRPDTASTGQPKEVVSALMHVTIDGTDHGALAFTISNGSNRESGQHNYTAQLHLEPIRPLFRQTDMSQKKLTIERYADRSYGLTIQ